jgi:hypothetical protein
MPETQSPPRQTWGLNAESAKLNTECVAMNGKRLFLSKNKDNAGGVFMIFLRYGKMHHSFYPFVFSHCEKYIAG